MQLPDGLIKTGIALEDRFFDLKGLSVYSSLGLSSLRYHIRENGLPHYSVRNDKWRDDIDRIADEVLMEFKTDRQSEGHVPRTLTSKRKTNRQ